MVTLINRTNGHLIDVQVLHETDVEFHVLKARRVFRLSKTLWYDYDEHVRRMLRLAQGK